MQDDKVVCRGVRAAELLLGRQLEAIRGLKALGVFVKVNSVVVPGVNDEHLPDVAAAMARLGVDAMNCIGMIPAAGTPFETLPGPPGELARLRAAAGAHLPQMKH